MFYYGWGLFLLVCVTAVPAVLSFVLRPLPSRSFSKETHYNWLPVSVIVAARNESPQIGTALQSLLNSDYGPLEVIAVNDRSTDDTGDILDELAKDYPCLKVVHVAELPNGWLGKNHAMHLAAQSATGRLLIFSDGDVVYEPHAIASAVGYVIDNRLDHLALLPAMSDGGFVERSLVAFFSFCFCVGLQPWLVRTPTRHAYVGVGAFNLVRRSVYKALKGHESLALEVLDDVRLGKMIKAAGCRTDVVRSPDALSVRWQESAWQVITGLEKNGYAALGYSLINLTITSVVFFIVFVIPYGVIAACPDWRASGHLAGILMIHVLLGWLSKTFRGGWATGIVMPFAAWGMAFAFWRSAWITIKQQGVRWRDTFYSLNELRDAAAADRVE